MGDVSPAVLWLLPFGLPPWLRGSPNPSASACPESDHFAEHSQHLTPKRWALLNRIPFTAFSPLLFLGSRAVLQKGQQFLSISLQQSIFVEGKPHRFQTSWDRPMLWSTFLAVFNHNRPVQRPPSEWLSCLRLHKGLGLSGSRFTVMACHAVTRWAPEPCPWTTPGPPAQSTPQRNKTPRGHGFHGLLVVYSLADQIVYLDISTSHVSLQTEKKREVEKKIELCVFGNPKWYDLYRSPRFMYCEFLKGQKNASTHDFLGLSNGVNHGSERSL